MNTHAEIAIHSMLQKILCHFACLLTSLIIYALLNFHYARDQEHTSSIVSLNMNY